MKPGLGSIERPMTITEALSSLKIKPGHTVWLRGGVYNYDALTCALQGTEEAPITFKPFPGEIAVIDAGWTANGAYTVWDCDYRIIFRWSGWTGRENTEGADASGLNAKGHDINTPGVQFRNAIIHDYSNVGFWSPATAGIYYGCVTYNIGYLGTDRGHGHILYTQNNMPEKLIKHCMGFNNFGWGIHAYTEDGTINNLLFVENVMFQTGGLDPNRDNPTYLLGGDVSATTSLWDGNCAYGPGMQFYGKGAVNVTFKNNYIPGGVTGIVEYALDENNVISAPENGTHIRLYPDDYTPERAYLAIYNWDGLDTVTVDVSDVFSPGDTLYLWSVQAGVDEVGERQDRAAYTVAQDGTIDVDMRASEHPVAEPYEWEAPETTFPTFGAFVVERV